MVETLTNKELINELERRDIAHKVSQKLIRLSEISSKFQKGVNYRLKYSGDFCHLTSYPEAKNMEERNLALESGSWKFVGQVLLDTMLSNNVIRNIFYGSSVNVNGKSFQTCYLMFGVDDEELYFVEELK